jgi:hypothetical protein
MLELKLPGNLKSYSQRQDYVEVLFSRAKVKIRAIFAV